MPGLTLVFQRRLREFGTRVLRQALPGASQGITAMPKDVRDIGALIAQVCSSAGGPRRATGLTLILVTE